VSAVGLVSAFLLNLSVQGVDCYLWRDRSDPAAHAKHYGQFTKYLNYRLFLL